MVVVILRKDHIIITPVRTPAQFQPRWTYLTTGSFQIWASLRYWCESSLEDWGWPVQQNHRIPRSQFRPDSCLWFWLLLNMFCILFDIGLGRKIFLFLRILITKNEIFKSVTALTPHAIQLVKKHEEKICPCKGI